jgi:hypothetical protein
MKVMNMKLKVKGAIGVLSVASLGLLGVVASPYLLGAKADDTTIQMDDAVMTIEGTAYEKFAKETVVDGSLLRFGDHNTDAGVCASTKVVSANDLAIEIKMFAEGDTSRTGTPLFTVSGKATTEGKLTLRDERWKTNEYLEMVCVDTGAGDNRYNAYLEFHNVRIGDLKNNKRYPLITSLSGKGHIGDLQIKSATVKNDLIIKFNGSLTASDAGTIYVPVGDSIHVTVSGIKPYSPVTRSSDHFIDASSDNSGVTVKAKHAGITKLTVKSMNEKTDISFTVVSTVAAPTPNISPKERLMITSEDKKFAEHINLLYDRNITSGVKDENNNYRFYSDDLITRGQFAAFMHRAAGSPDVSQSDIAANFTDAKTHQFGYEIAWLKAQGVVEGVDDGFGTKQFLPDEPIKRSEVAKMLVKTFGLDALTTTNTATKFEDVSDDDNIETLAKLKIAGGVKIEDKWYFHPSDTILRGQVAKMLANTLLKVSGKDSFTEK